MHGRRATLAFLASSAALGYLAPVSAQTNKVFRVGALAGNDEATTKPFEASFLAGMRDLGYEIGRNLELDVRYANGDGSRLAPLADDLIARRPDVLVGLHAAAVVMHAKTTAIPIVVALSVDPVSAGLVQGLGRPGTNVTGTVAPYLELLGKQIEVLSEVVSNLSRLAVFFDPSPAPEVRRLGFDDAIGRLAGARRMTTTLVRAGSPADITKAFATPDVARAEGLVVPGTFAAIRLRDDIIKQALQLRLPSISAVARWADAGGLIFYGVNVAAGMRAVAPYVDKIFKGAKPADLPMEQPTIYEVVVNLKTAHEIGIKIPQSVLIRADRVIE